MSAPERVRRLEERVAGLKAEAKRDREDRILAAGDDEDKTLLAEFVVTDVSLRLRDAMADLSVELNDSEPLPPVIRAGRTIGTTSARRAGPVSGAASWPPSVAVASTLGARPKPPTVTISTTGRSASRRTATLRPCAALTTTLATGARHE